MELSDVKQGPENDVMTVDRLDKEYLAMFLQIDWILDVKVTAAKDNKKRATNTKNYVKCRWIECSVKYVHSFIFFHAC